MSLNVAALSLILFSVIVIVLGIVKVHTLPGNIAKQRGHPQAQAIEVASLLGLLIFPIWMFALVWAYGGVIGAPLPEPPPAPPADDDAKPDASASASGSAPGPASPADGEA